MTRSDKYENDFEEDLPVEEDIERDYDKDLYNWLIFIIYSRSKNNSKKFG